MRQEKKNKTVIKVSDDIELDINGAIMTFKDLLDLLKEAKASKDKEPRIAPAVIRKYQCAIESRNKLQNLLDGVRILYSQNRQSGITEATRSVHGLLRPYFENFLTESENRLLKAIELANLCVEDAKKEYERSIYCVKAA
jgi:hypothetical protein